MRINTNYNGINIDITLDNKIYKLLDKSGSGKTLLMQAISEYCLNNSITHTLINYKQANIPKDNIINSCRNIDIVMMDNADLYITDDILKEVSKTAKCMLISIKDSDRLFVVDAVDMAINYNKLNLTAKELR